MNGFLIAEEGPLTGLVIRLVEGEEWIIGRDPDEAFQVLEDPMVSRKHVICRKTDEGIVLENLSATNPASINGKPVIEPILLQERDTLQIGNNFFRFSEEDPAYAPYVEPIEEDMTIFEEGEEPLDAVSLSPDVDTRWLIKIISGPNAGAEFGVEAGATYVIGKDSASCDIVFQDLSVSRQHAKLIAEEEGNVFIEDLNSSNGVLINGLPIPGQQQLASQDLVALGTTTFLMIDRHDTQETIISPPMMFPGMEAPIEETTEETAEVMTQKTWKDMIIPTRHLVLASLFGLLILVGIGGMVSLFKGKKIEVVTVDESGKVRDVVNQFPTVEFTFNQTNGTLFLLGHVLTEVDHQELSYLLKSLPFVNKIEDNVVIDDLVSESVNALLMKNPSWRGVNVSAPRPGVFLLKGYVQTVEVNTELSDYLNLNFPYQDKLENLVVVENTLQTEIQSLLIDGGFVNVTFQLSNGELILAGRVAEKERTRFDAAATDLKKVPGIRSIKNFVIFTTASTARIDITSKYRVSGSSKVGNVSQYVVINGRILSDGDHLDGMIITSIGPQMILLEKDGLKYQINYNQQ